MFPELRLQFLASACTYLRNARHAQTHELRDFIQLVLVWIEIIQTHRLALLRVQLAEGIAQESLVLFLHYDLERIDGVLVDNRVPNRRAALDVSNWGREADEIGPMCHGLRFVNCVECQVGSCCRLITGRGAT